MFLTLRHPLSYDPGAAEAQSQMDKDAETKTGIESSYESFPGSSKGRLSLISSQMDGFDPSKEGVGS